MDGKHINRPPPRSTRPSDYGGRGGHHNHARNDGRAYLSAEDAREALRLRAEFDAQCWDNRDSFVRGLT